MDRAYVLTHSVAASGISGAITLLQLKAGTNHALEILRAALYEYGSTTQEQLGVEIVRKTAAATVTTAVAGTHLNKYDADLPTSDASLGTSATGVIATAEGTDGDVLVQRGFNDLSGFEWLPTPEERIVVPVSGIIALKLLSAPASNSQTYLAEIVFRQL